jgi:hypothetical protein
VEALGVVDGVDEVTDFAAGVVDIPEGLAVDFFGLQDKGTLPIRIKDKGTLPFEDKGTLPFTSSDKPIKDKRR